ncbi:DUF2157 domain-containing protein [Phyllobacterium sp. 0TCS1.6C]|uniref:DUF2157 domain-containing protein n=1 Tax=unclassified Phyllobacterium TaxID=2638441 RepID=UPI002264F737|nr:MULTISPECIES: DUF2157 domain-containing protein [unclassified Phyllobacterium]MCX8281673.1 DUF2157 domain-containing protein [Phyllobacterium sp. 0TCS1.6C]MCX8294783.1 DUF2157 domain-containing protein [Phyllobacterium sp. 0TCS1.6A]
MAVSFGINRHISRWESKGIIDSDTAARLRSDVETSRSGFGLGGILAVLGAVLLGAAILSLIAANWEVMPRLVRLVLIVAVIWAGYLGGAWRVSRGERMLGEAFYLIAAITFGAGIALVGQMYHLAGEPAEAVLLWVAGVMIAALLLRSEILASGSVVLTGLFLFLALDDGGRFGYSWLLPILLLLCAGLAWYTGARAARHLIAILAIVYVFVLRIDLDEAAIFWPAALVGGGLFLVDALRHPLLERWSGWSKAVGAYGFSTLLLVLIFLQFDEFEGTVRGEVMAGFLILACSVAGLSLSGYRNPAVRWIAYSVFSFEVIYLAFKTIGTMIGTAGFFLSAGVLVLLLAVFVMRMERRLKQRAQLTEATP